MEAAMAPTIRKLPIVTSVPHAPRIWLLSRLTGVSLFSPDSSVRKVCCQSTGRYWVNVLHGGSKTEADHFLWRDEAAAGFPAGILFHGLEAVIRSEAMAAGTGSEPVGLHYVRIERGEQQAMDTHVRVAAWLRIVGSAFGLLLALPLLLALGGFGIVISVLGGALVGVPLVTLIVSFLALAFAVTALPGLITGWGLLTYRPWARYVNVALSAFDLFNVPVGTALGAYSIWVMLHPETVPLFETGEVPGRYPVHF
jgi:hypothetical protein